MTHHFPHVRVHGIDNFYRGSFKEKTRKLTKTAFVEFSSTDVRDQVLAKISGNSIKFIFKGDEVVIKKAMSRDALARNGALNKCCSSS